VGKANFAVNVTVEDLGPCKKLVRFEIDQPVVEEAFVNAKKEFVKHANFPGFRPGKAPEHMVTKKYEKEIEEEVKRKLMADSYQKALKEQKLDVIGYPDIEEIQFAVGQPLQFAATVETAPQFEMP